METNTARNFALQLGSLIALYISLSAIITVIFGVINVLHPDSAEGYWAYDSAQQGIRIGVAMVIVFFPTYIFLTRLVNQIRRKETGAYLVLTKWLVYLSILVGGCILLGDLVVVILTYLNGEVTLRFILKAGALMLVIGAALYYYLQDAKLYWNTHEKESKTYAAGASLIAIAVLALGFMNSDTPKEVREMKLDDQQTQSLQEMQYRIEDHYRINKSLPEDTTMLYVGGTEPTAPEGRDAYTYKIVDGDTYELCATFAYPSQTTGMSVTEPSRISPEEAIKNPYNNWDHTAGKTCFERTVIDYDNTKAI